MDEEQRDRQVAQEGVEAGLRDSLKRELEGEIRQVVEAELREELSRELRERLVARLKAELAEEIRPGSPESRPSSKRRSWAGPCLLPRSGNSSGSVGTSGSSIWCSW